MDTVRLFNFGGFVSLIDGITPCGAALASISV